MLVFPAFVGAEPLCAFSIVEHFSFLSVKPKMAITPTWIGNVIKQNQQTDEASHAGQFLPLRPHALFDLILKEEMHTDNLWPIPCNFFASCLLPQYSCNHSNEILRSWATTTLVERHIATGLWLRNRGLGYPGGLYHPLARARHPRRTCFPFFRSASREREKRKNDHL